MCWDTNISIINLFTGELPQSIYFRNKAEFLKSFVTVGPFSFNYLLQFSGEQYERLLFLLQIYSTL